MAKKKGSGRPCEATHAGPYACFWQLRDSCAAYNPSVEVRGDLRLPRLSNSIEVPLEFCKSHQIIRSDVDSYFNRNITTMKIEGLEKRITKMDERTADTSGSLKKTEVSAPQKKSAKKSGGNMVEIVDQSLFEPLP